MDETNFTEEFNAAKGSNSEVEGYANARSF